MSKEKGKERERKWKGKGREREWKKQGKGNRKGKEGKGKGKGKEKVIQGLHVVSGAPFPAWSEEVEVGRCPVGKALRVWP